MTDGHKSWNNRIWRRNWVQNKMTGCHEIWDKHWNNRSWIFQCVSHRRVMLVVWGEMILYLEASKKKVQITDKFFNGIFFGIKRRVLMNSLLEHLVVVWYAELSNDGLVKTQQIFFATASVEHPGDCRQMTNRENPENQESNRCESMYVLCILTFLFQSTRNQPSHFERTSNIHSSWPGMGTPLDALAVKQQRPWGLRVTTRKSGHESPSHVFRCRPQFTSQGSA